MTYNKPSKRNPKNQSKDKITDHGKTPTIEGRKSHSNNENKQQTVGDNKQAPRVPFTILTKSSQQAKPKLNNMEELSVKLNSDLTISNKDETTSRNEKSQTVSSKSSNPKSTNPSRNPHKPRINASKKNSHQDDQNRKEAVHATAATDSSKAGTKVVVRSLPPNITEAEFLDSIEAKFKPHINWHRFVPGRIRKSQDKAIQHSTCYINFINHNEAEIFRRNCQGNTYSDQYHKIYRIIIVYSPFQKVPRKQEMLDRRSSTIEKDPVYVKFLENLSESKKRTENSPPESQEIPLLINDQGDKVTPLLLAFHNRHGIQTQISGKNYTPFDYQQEFKTESNNYTWSKEGRKNSQSLKKGNKQRKGSDKHSKPPIQILRQNHNPEKFEELDNTKNNKLLRNESLKTTKRFQNDNFLESKTTKRSGSYKKIDNKGKEDNSAG